jgi:hypothetical protein
MNQPPLSPNHVVVTDVRMPFWSMVVFMVKLAIAAIPAFILLAIIGAIATAILGALGMGLGSLMAHHFST